MSEPDVFQALSVAVLTVSDTRTTANDTSGDLIQERLQDAGHRLAARRIVRDDLHLVREQLTAWVRDVSVDIIIATGGTGLTRRDITPEAAAPLLTKPIPGFGELFRSLSYAEIGASTIQSRAEAGIAEGTVLFLLPGSPNACRLALEKIILPQLDRRTRPCNITQLLPRIRHE